MMIRKQIPHERIRAAAGEHHYLTARRKIKVFLDF